MDGDSQMLREAAFDIVLLGREGGAVAMRWVDAASTIGFVESMVELRCAD